MKKIAIQPQIKFVNSEIIFKEKVWKSEDNYRIALSKRGKMPLKLFVKWAID